MERTRKVLYESATIIIMGVVIALLITGAMRYLHKPTIKEFQEQYTGHPLEEQVTVADRYLNSFSAGELNKSIEDQNAEGFCHSQAHALGRAVYKRYPNLSDAIRQCGNACTFGCFHGVLMEMFSTESDSLGGVIEAVTPAEYIRSVQTVAKDLCDRPEVSSAVKARYCFHGLGHVFGYLNGANLNGGLASCAIYSDAYAGLYCRSGVFMEYLFSTSSAKILYTKGPEPCDAYPAYTNKCYRYKAYGWLKVWGGLAPALKACDTFGANTLLCISNTAEAAATPVLLAKDQGFEEMCGTLLGKKREACIEGAIMKIIDLNNGDDSEHICDVVAPDYRAACLGVRGRYQADMFYEAK